MMERNTQRGEESVHPPPLHVRLCNIAIATDIVQYSTVHCVRPSLTTYPCNSTHSTGDHCHLLLLTASHRCRLCSTKRSCVSWSWVSLAPCSPERMARLAAEPFASSTTSGVQLALRRANMRLMGLSGAAGREEKNLGYLSLIFT